ncbi:hypothetical protein [Streptomyces sp. PD-S100-1]|uniref:hypothetical protein n=1 Tax=Streptomyces sp. PD-S100-1 TaxID=3394351 RepID=UPI0039BC4432
MYESAHFISSKYTSGFYGRPMPAEFPDYPVWWQIRDHIRQSGRDWGLYEKATFNTSVERADTLPDERWQVRLSDGRVLEYDGLIAAPGVTWHAKRPSLHRPGDLPRRGPALGRLPVRTGRVLVIGAGNSGVDIASDAARHAAPDHDALSSHPVMNSQVLHHLTHGDLVAKPDISRFTPTGAVFKDGTAEDLDLLLLCTGYEHRIPFLDPDLFTWKAGRPQLCLNVFNRRHDSLYALGLIEFADAAYLRFDEMAQLVVMDIRAREADEHRTARRRLKADDHPDLRGGIAYIDSPRHANYVESRTYQDYLAGLRDTFGWPDLDHDYYDGIRPDAPPSPHHPSVPTDTTCTRDVVLSPSQEREPARQASCPPAPVPDRRRHGRCSGCRSVHRHGPGRRRSAPPSPPGCRRTPWRSRRTCSGR